MNIISKYKDFYDYIVQDHDADITYVRHIGLINEYLDDLFHKDGNSIPCYSKYYGYMNKFAPLKDGEMMFDNYIFGIYPFVYSQPILKIHDSHNYSSYSKIIVLSKSMCDNLLSSDSKIAQDTLDNELIPLAEKEFNNPNIKVRFLRYSKLSDIQKSLKSYIWKVECQNIFYRIQSPVFVKYNINLFYEGAYWDNWPKEPRLGLLKDTHYVTGISLQKLNYNITKYWMDDLFVLNTYINIENFLWSIKQEIVSTPDNKTKIIAHGFDIKTSFRKM